MSITFPTPPLLKVLRAWKFLGGAPGSINSPADRSAPTPAPGSLNQTAWDAGDRLRASTVQTVGDAQDVLDDHSDTT